MRAIISAHLNDAYVDPFQADEETGYLSYRSFLSWLWFDFSTRLAKIKIGYCERCGKPFSLVGGRGKPRRFCSQRCKTEAKNERMRQRRDGVREKFVSGSSVEEIATGIEGESPKSETVEYVRRCLSTWPKLKHLTDDAFELEGVKSELVQRCIRDGLGWDAFSERTCSSLKRLLSEMK